MCDHLRRERVHDRRGARQRANHSDDEGALRLHQHALEALDVIARHHMQRILKRLFRQTLQRHVFTIGASRLEQVRVAWVDGLPMPQLGVEPSSSSTNRPGRRTCIPTHESMKVRQLLPRQ